MSDLSGDALIAQTLAEADGKKPKKSMVAAFLPVAILTLVAIGGGAGVGWLIGSSSVEQAAAALKPEKLARETEAARAESPDTIIKLQSVITNISTPPKIVVRLQGSLVVRKAEVDNVDVLAGQVQGDALAFLRTIDLAQIEGARGLLHLKEDLTERAKLRSPAVTDFLVESLVAQ